MFLMDALVNLTSNAILKKSGGMCRPPNNFRMRTDMNLKLSLRKSVNMNP